jgi:hypothetical protein
MGLKVTPTTYGSHVIYEYLNMKLMDSVSDIEISSRFTVEEKKRNAKRWVGARYRLVDKGTTWDTTTSFYTTSAEDITLSFNGFTGIAGTKGGRPAIKLHVVEDDKLCREAWDTDIIIYTDIDLTPVEETYDPLDELTSAVEGRSEQELLDIMCEYRYLELYIKKSETLLKHYYFDIAQDSEYHKYLRFNVEDIEIADTSVFNRINNNCVWSYIVINTVTTKF